MARDIALLFETRGVPDFVEVTTPEQGRIETQRIGCSTVLNPYLDFPYSGHAFLIEHRSVDKKTGEHTREDALGITSRTPQTSLTATRTDRQPRALEQRKPPVHHRLELR